MAFPCKVPDVTPEGTLPVEDIWWAAQGLRHGLESRAQAGQLAARGMDSRAGSKVRLSSGEAAPEPRDLGPLVGGGERKGSPNSGFIRTSQGIRTKRERGSALVDLPRDGRARISQMCCLKGKLLFLPFIWSNYAAMSCCVMFHLLLSHTNTLSTCYVAGNILSISVKKTVSDLIWNSSVSIVN